MDEVCGKDRKCSVCAVEVEVRKVGGKIWQFVSVRRKILGRMEGEDVPKTRGREMGR